MPLKSVDEVVENIRKALEKRDRLCANSVLDEAKCILNGNTGINYLNQKYDDCETDTGRQYLRGRIEQFRYDLSAIEVLKEKYND